MNTVLRPDELAARCEPRATVVNRVFNFVYGWMAVGLVISGLVAWFFSKAILSGQVPVSRGLFTACSVGEVALVLGLSLCIHRLAPAVATLLFLLFSALNGLTLSVVFLLYSMATVQLVFFITAAMFAGMALIGTFTTKSLAGVGRLCIMGLWGVIVALVVNLFLGSSQFDYLLSFISVALFVGLTAWDAQKVNALVDMADQTDSKTLQRLGILCALQLYLDFINLFIHLLRIFGGRGRGQD